LDVILYILQLLCQLLIQDGDHLKAFLNLGLYGSMNERLFHRNYYYKLTWSQPLHEDNQVSSTGSSSL